MVEIKTKLRKLVSDGKVKEAINILLSTDIDDGKKKKVVAISSRFKNLQEQQNLGILTFEQANVTENRIVNNLIDVIENLDDPDVDKKGSDTPGIPAKKSHRNIFAGTVIAIAVLIGLLEIFNVIDIFPGGTASKNLQLTIFVTDTKGNPVLENEGRINIPLGNRSLNEVIGVNGRTNFADITSDNKGDTIIIGLEAEGWEIAQGKNSFIFDGEPIRLQVQRDKSLATIKGVVKSRDGQEFLADAEVRINTDTIIRTDANGVFEIVLPENMQVKSLSEAYNLTISAENYKTTSQYFFPKTTADVRLVKK